MIKGFSLIEVIVALTITGIILCIIVANVSDSVVYAGRITSNQKRLEDIFHTVDAIRSDLTKCGMRIQEVSSEVGFPMMMNTSSSMKVIYGVCNEQLLENGVQGETEIHIHRNGFFSSRKKILIYEPESNRYEFNEITATKGDRLTLAHQLKAEYPKNTLVVALKEVEYKLYLNQQALKRKVNRGYFQPMIENVTDFYVQYFPETASIYYRLEIGRKEQIRGYVFLINTVPQ